MASKKVAVACQEGGTHAAFTWGVLTTILRTKQAWDSRPQDGDTFEIVAVSGTSAGALCALATWYGLVPNTADPDCGMIDKAIERLDHLWTTFAATTPVEILHNQMVGALLQSKAQGVPLPGSNPYASYGSFGLIGLSMMGARREYLEFPALLEALCPDFATIAWPQLAQRHMRILAGAIEVLSGNFEVFDSDKTLQEMDLLPIGKEHDQYSSTRWRMRRSISLEGVAASGTLPEILPAQAIPEMVFPTCKPGTTVTRTGHYWDGLYSQNPPVRDLLDSKEKEQKPDEIWIIRINPQEFHPSSLNIGLEDIRDRENDLAGNLSLNQELDHILTVNGWLKEHGDSNPPLNNRKIVEVRTIKMTRPPGDYGTRRSSTAVRRIMPSCATRAARSRNSGSMIGARSAKTSLLIPMTRGIPNRRELRIFGQYRWAGSMRTQIGTLVIATSIIQLANGFFGTFISLRVAIENFDAAGLVLSAYFAGFTLGALRCGKIIERIGHIRAFAAFAGLVAAATAVMPLVVGSLAWVILRAIVGFGCAGIFLTTESWLSAKAVPSERGRVFSIYMVGTFLALALGQLLIARADVKAAGPFSAIVALFAVALVMVTAARAEPPPVSATAALPYGVLARAAPIAVVGSALSGLVGGAFYALVPAWMQDQGIARATIALFMLVAMLGGFAFQIPVGRLSDRFDRRIVLALLGLGFAVTVFVMVLSPRSLPTLLPEAALLGGFMSTLYPVCVANAHDRMPADRIVAVSGWLILVSGVGSVLGPLIGASLKPHFEIDGVFYFMAAAALLLAIVAGLGVLMMPAPKHLEAPFKIMAPQAGPLAHDPLDASHESSSAQ